MGDTLPRTRIIPICDFYTRLQLEYLSYRMRALTYQRAFDKKKFDDICTKKREKIVQIALENRLPSIFNSEEQRVKYLSKFLNDGGCPNFCYRDDYQARVKGYYDKFYYFAEGSSVRVTIDASVELGCIIKCDIQDERLTVNVNGSTVEASFAQVQRVFPTDFHSKLFL